MNITTTELENNVVETVVVLRLRRRPQVRFTDETIDNEHLNRKKSKVCCIKHPDNSKKCVNKYERG